MEKAIDTSYSKDRCKRNIEVRIRHQTIGVFRDDSLTPFSRYTLHTCLNFEQNNVQCFTCKYKPIEAKFL
jgi:hypothetical protein